MVNPVRGAKRVRLIAGYNAAYCSIPTIYVHFCFTFYYSYCITSFLFSPGERVLSVILAQITAAETESPVNVK